MSNLKQEDVTHIDDAVPAADEKLQVDRSKVGVIGTVQLTAGKVVYIPTPTADPRGTCTPCPGRESVSADQQTP